MALTITTNTVSTKASGTTAFAIGQRLTWTIGVVASGLTVFTDNALFFNPAMWLETMLPDNNTTVPPNQGWAVQFGNSFPESGFLDIVPGDSTLPWENIRVAYTLTNANILELQFTFFASFDTCSYMENRLLNNTSRFTKNSTNNNLSFDNSISSVYNSEKSMRAHVIVADTKTQNVLDQTHAHFLMEARYFEDGVLGASAEFTNWSYSLERNSIEVDTLSSFEDTILKVQVDAPGVGDINLDTQIVTYRDNDVQNVVGFVEDMKFGSDGPLGFKEGVDYIAAETPWALVAGTTYEKTWTIDHTLIDFAGTYKFLIVVSDLAKALFNSFTTVDTILADQLPAPITGTMTGTINDYNETFSNDCLQVAPYERIESCVTVDKASYDAALSAASLPGSFGFNLSSVRVRVILLDSIFITDPFDAANTVILDVNNLVGDPSLTIQNTPTDYTSCVTFRTQPEWINSVFVVIHTYTYNIQLANNPYEDIIHYKQTFSLQQLEENKTTPFLTSIVFEDQAGNPALEICEDFDGPLVVKITKISTLPDDYNLIAVIKPDVPDIEVDEEESYDNGYLPQLSSALLLNVDTTFGVDDEAVFEVEDSLLEIGQKYLVAAIAKIVNPLAPGFCPIINIATETDCTLTTPTIVPVGVDADYTISFDITNFAPSTVATVTIDTSTLTANPDTATGPNQNDAFVAATGSYVYTVNWTPYQSNPVQIQLDIVVTLVSGCSYSYTAFHDMIPLIGRITTDDADVNAD